MKAARIAWGGKPVYGARLASWLGAGLGPRDFGHPVPAPRDCRER